MPTWWYSVIHMLTTVINFGGQAYFFVKKDANQKFNLSVCSEAFAVLVKFIEATVGAWYFKVPDPAL
jgi:hypothetical protein